MYAALTAFPDLLQRHTEVTLLRAPWAPGLVVAFGRWSGPLVPMSPLATGKGRDEAAAIAGCLGEMAENLSIGVAAHPAPVWVEFAQPGLPQVDARALDLGQSDDPGSEGCACHGDPAEAARRALCERLERAALALWWEGRLVPQALVLQPGLEAVYRQGQTARRTRAWRIDPFPGVCVVLVMTDDGADRLRVIGTASDAAQAAATDAALREALLAEIALLAPPDHPDHQRALRLDRTLEAHLPGLLRATGMSEVGAPGETTMGTMLMSCRAAGHAVGFADLTHPVLGLPVVRCVCPTLPRWRTIAP